MNDVKTKESRLEELASELAENVTSQKDLMNSFSTLMSMTLQKALDAEMATSKKTLKAMMVNFKFNMETDLLMIKKCQLHKIIYRVKKSLLLITIPFLLIFIIEGGMV